MLDHGIYSHGDPLTNTMQMGIRSRLNDPSLVPLKGVLVAGMLADVTLSPGPVLTDIPDVGFPLGILIGLLVFAYLTRFHNTIEQLENESVSLVGSGPLWAGPSAFG